MNTSPAPQIPRPHGDENEKDAPEVSQPPTKWTRNLRLDSHEPDARKASVGNRNRREKHQSFVRGRTPAIDDAGGHKDGKGDHFLEFERQKLRCVVRVSNLPHLIPQGCGYA